MLKDHSRQLNALLLTFEVLLNAGIFALLVFHPGSPASVEGVIRGAEPSLWILAAIACSAWVVVLPAVGLRSSQRREPLWRIFSRLVAAGAASSVLVAAAAFILSAPVEPIFALLFGVSQVAVLSLVRAAIFSGLRIIRRQGRNYRNLLVVGSGPRARDVRDAVNENPGWAIRIVGYADDVDYVGDARDPLGQVSKFSDLPALFRDNVIDEVVVAYPRTLLHTLGPVVEACRSVGVPVTIPVDFFGDYLPAPRVTRFGEGAALSYAPVHHSSYKLAAKRLIDVVGASVAVVVFAPLLLASMLAIRLTSRGPAIFKQTRCGLNGREFSMYKLRTMVADAEDQKEALEHMNESDGPVFKIRNDPRVTPVGRFLRRTSLDELPQFWNVLKGDMSLVGPRPPVPREVARYETFQRRRLSMRPGLTCFWQVQGRSEISFADWVKLDVEYIESWGLGTDFWIMMKTVPAVLSRTGAS